MHRLILTMSATNFDDYAADYADIMGTAPCFLYCDLNTLLEQAGDFTDKAILELGCGEGMILRFLRDQGANGQLLGVDLSTHMIETARAHEAQQARNIEYRCADITANISFGHFDLVLAPLLFSLAPDRQQLRHMFQTAGNSLRLGGRLLIMDENVFLSPTDYAKTKPYGYSKSLQAPLHDGMLVEGTKLYCQVGEGESAIRVIETFLPWEAWQEAALAADLTSLEWQSLHVSKTGIERFGQDYWTDYLHLPLTICLTATKRKPPAKASGFCVPLYSN